MSDIKLNIERKKKSPNYISKWMRGGPLGVGGEERVRRNLWGYGNALYLDWEGSIADVCTFQNSLNVYFK